MIRESVYISPDTGLPLLPTAEMDGMCSSQGERFDIRNGIVYLLPSRMENDEVKNREKEGWRLVVERHDWEFTADTVLTFPEAGTDVYWTKVRECMPLVDGALGDLSNKLGLDLACGIGWGAAHFTKRGARMIAADFNDTRHNGLGAAVLTREKGVYFDAICCDGEALPISEHALDFAFICSALHHFTRPSATLRELHRVLKPGGLLIDICESYRTGKDDENREAGYEPLATFREAGINEMSYLESEYHGLFVSAGFEYSVFLPEWDAASTQLPGPMWKNAGLATRPTHRSAWKHGLLQVLKHTPAIDVMRDRKLHRTVSNRAIIARKPAAGIPNPRGSKL